MNKTDVQRAVSRLTGEEYEYLITEEEVKNSLWVARKVIGHLWDELPFWKKIVAGIKALLGALDGYLYETGE